MRTRRNGQSVRPGGDDASGTEGPGRRTAGIDDAALVRAAAGGDQRAFAALVDRHRPGVTHLASRFCREPAGVEDLVQEVFVKAYLNLGGLRDGGMVRSWLHRIAANTCIDWLRRRRAEIGLVGGLDDTLPDEGEQARGQAREARRRLEAAMAVLGPKDRLLVALLGLEGKSVEEVAAITGLSQVNVKVRAFRARRRLKAFLEKDHG
ncbi:RNA polymerase sigma factor [Solidesulfovibrio sp.]